MNYRQDQNSYRYIFRVASFRKMLFWYQLKITNFCKFSSNLGILREIEFDEPWSFKTALFAILKALQKLKSRASKCMKMADFALQESQESSKSISRKIWVIENYEIPKWQFRFGLLYGW